MDKIKHIYGNSKEIVADTSSILDDIIGFFCDKKVISCCSCSSMSCLIILIIVATIFMKKRGGNMKSFFSTMPYNFH